MMMNIFFTLWVRNHTLKNKAIVFIAFSHQRSPTVSKFSITSPIRSFPHNDFLTNLALPIFYLTLHV